MDPLELMLRVFQKSLCDTFAYNVLVMQLNFVYHWFAGDLQQLNSVATGLLFPIDKLSFLCS